MATTTNYGWATPDDTDLVKDGAAAIRTLGSSADTTVKNLSPGTTAGDLDYYTSGTAKARLGIGTAGQLLTVNSGATAPEWAAPPSGGKVLQVIQATSTSTTTSTSTSYVSTGLTGTITPSSATSKVLIFYNFMLNSNDSNEFVAHTIFRGTVSGTNLASDNLGWIQVGALSLRTTATGHYLDAPNTTAATTYTVAFKVESGNTGIVNPGANNNTAVMILMEIAA
jgi:hypothetical protein